MDHQEKIERLRALVEADASDALTHFLLGRELMEVGRFAEAAEYLEKTIQLNPDYTAAYRFLGDAHRDAGNTARAREVYEVGIGVSEATGDLQAGKEMKVFLKKLGDA
jgi:predicted Zn-dependent protease